MRFTGLARLAAVGVTALATMAAGLVATPAAASSTSSKPKVSVSTPEVSPKRYNGACPVTVTFSAKVKVKVSGKTTIAYRWLRGDGSKSKVKKQVVKGKGVKTVALKEKATFKDDVKGWEALQVLSPRKVTTKKGHFSVSCDSPVVFKVVKKKRYARAYVDVHDYVGACTPSARITAKGMIKVSHPTWVKYRWIRDGKVVDYGKVKVVRDKKVSYTFRPRHSHKGWVTLDIVSPGYGGADRDDYRVWCKKRPAPPAPPAEATASVTAPSGYTGTCPVNRVFTGTVTVDRIGRGTTVQYRWAGPGYQGPAETLTFAQGDPQSKDVSYTAEVTDSGVVQRWIEILSPNTAVSNTAEVQVECQPLKVRILNVDINVDYSTCGTPGQGPAIKFSAPISVNGPAVVEYRWSFNNGAIVVPGSFEVTEPGTVTVSHQLPSSPMTANAMRAELRITSHNATGWVVDFERPCPTT